MMLKISLLPLCLTLMAAAPTNSTSAADANQEKAAAAGQGGAGANSGAPVAEKKICKALPDTTSRIPKRACLTAAQWKQVEADLKE